MPHRPLTRAQRQALRGLIWLHDPEVRAEGRTYVLALSYLLRILRQNNGWITVEDDADTSNANHELLRAIQMITLEHGAGCDVLGRRFRLTGNIVELDRFMGNIMIDLIGSLSAVEPAEGTMTSKETPWVAYGPLCKHRQQSQYQDTQTGAVYCNECGTEVRQNAGRTCWLQVYKEPGPVPTTAWERILKDEP